MGKRIDRLVQFIAITSIAFLIFLRAFDSIPLSIGFTFLCAMLQRRFWAAHRPRMRHSAREAQEILRTWAHGNDDESKKAIVQLLSSKRSDVDAALVYIARHPSCSLSLGDVFGAWKANRGKRQILLASTGYADGRARTFSETLTEPTVELWDAARLISLIRRSTLSKPSNSKQMPLLQRIKFALSALPEQRPWHKSALYGVALGTVYWLSGNALYLFLALTMLFLAGISKRFQHKPGL